MEYLDQSVQEYLFDKNNLTNKVSVIAILLQMFDAIKCFHETTKMVHRDLNPDHFRM